MFKTVLFPIDGSREAREATDAVVNIVQTYQSRLILLSVIEEQIASPDDPTLPDIMASPEAIAELLQKAQSLFAAKGIQTQAIERQGKPAFTICDVADEVNADLIIMGCRGMGLTEDGIADSVTNRVINLSPCPVLIVP
jgi:nucleotide-binding universal stress UspA family protein